MKFVICDYSATGEGRTICILITYARPRNEDYEIQPTFERDDQGKMQYVPGTLKVSEEFILLREFAEIFGGYMAMGAEQLDQEKFLARCGHMVPQFVIKSITEPIGNFRYFAEIHYNLS